MFKYFFNYLNKLISSLLALACANAMGEPAYRPVEHYQPNGLIPVCVNAHYSACGLWDRTGKWRLEPLYAAIYENGNMWTVVTHAGMTGLLDAEGKTLIEPRFGEIGTFVDGLAYAKNISVQDERYGYINTQGNWVIKPQFMYPVSFEDGLALVRVPGDRQEEDFEDRRLGLLSTSGEIRFLPFADAEDPAGAGGRYVVYQQLQFGNGEPRDMGVADKTGKLIVPWVRAQNIALIPQGGWIVQEAAPSKATVVYARNGKEVFRVSGEEAYIYYSNPQSVAVFTQDGEREGLVNLLTGKVLIKPQALNLGDVANGLVGFTQPATGEKVALSGYLDFKGHVVTAPSLPNAPAFEGKVVAACKAESSTAQPDAKKPACTVLTRAGQRVKAFDQYNASFIQPFAWETGPQEPALRDVMNVLVEYKESADGQINTKKLLTNQAGELILSIVPEGECGREVVRNHENKVVWPHYPEQTCAVTSMYQQPPANSPPTLLAAYKELQAFERNKTLERAKMVSQGGGIENLLPGAKKTRAQFEQLPWVTGPAEVTFTGGEAKLNLPEGYYFISAQARKDALAQNKSAAVSGTTDNTVDESSVQTDLIAGPDFRWVLRLVSLPRGYVDLSQGLPPAQDLLKTMKAYRGGDPSKTSASENFDNLMRQWALEPQLDIKRQRLAYAYGGTGLNQHVEFNLVRFGRQTELFFMTGWTSMYTTNDFEIYQQEITQLVDAVEFLPKRGYLDYQQGDTRAPYNLLSQLITGLPSEEFLEFSNAIKRYEERKQAKINGLLVKLAFVILAILGLLASRTKSKKT